MSDWSGTIVSMAFVTPTSLEGYKFVGRLSHDMKVREHKRELWVSGDEYMLYDYVTSRDMPINVGAVKGPLSGKEVMREHPELADKVELLN